MSESDPLEDDLSFLDDDNTTVQEPIKEPVRETRREAPPRRTFETKNNTNQNNTKKMGESDKLVSMMEKENVIRLVLEHWHTDNSSNGSSVEDKEAVLKMIIDAWKV
jgi:hypothetical protein